MRTLDDFIDALQRDEPEAGLSAQLKALWYDGKGNWGQAHAQVDHLTDAASAWVHAYLHRKEGDTANADYWYRRAGKSRPALSLDEEWADLVAYFLNG